MNNAFITIQPGADIAMLHVPYIHLWNSKDCALCTAAFADKLNAIGYEVQSYEEKTVFDLSRDSLPDFRTFKVKITRFSRSFMEDLLVNTHKLTIGHPGHGYMAFSKRQIDFIKL